MINPADSALHLLSNWRQIPYQPRVHEVISNKGTLCDTLCRLYRVTWTSSCIWTSGPVVQRFDSAVQRIISTNKPGEILRPIFQPWALSSDIPARRKGLYLFYNPPNNFSRRRRVDRSCIYCGFFRNCQPALYLSVTGVCKKSFLVLAWTFVCYLVFPSVEIKSDDGYQIGLRISSDNHRSILYYALNFIQWEPPENIRWAINRYFHQIRTIKTAIRPLSYWRQTHKLIMWIEKDVETTLSNRKLLSDW